MYELHTLSSWTLWPTLVPVLFLVLMLLVAATVPLARGKLERIADLRLRGVRFLVAALVVQTLILLVFDGADPALLGAVYVATFAMAGSSSG